jgi:hypothetical protein
VTNGLLWGLFLVTCVGAASTLTVRAVSGGRSPWPGLIAVWAALAIAGHIVSGPGELAKSALIAATLALPLGIAALVARAALRRGRSAWRAGGVGFASGTVVAAITPLLQLFLLCRVTGDCV